ncbi:3'(2'),5'-bisphosphate nucleotidase CysQ [Oceanobacillus luteolus]|uniref:3'(2'),5'-bisphosphate nucleotidase CysQ n=1 Tax=Oceanobacillus luteolus TaxID=1274358 RepID=A0ABW4HX25_9BACI|nr:3'(2'),5'-bisphosphate nucleotidase CysQ [Oceanobacillus luteolus]MCM3740875.1 3'(2'),5'-bisphosphate nucleotidase CysQ [Oceanobacillus luteolus]
MDHFLSDLTKIVLEAGKEILDVYGEDFDFEYKEDDSPLTLADQRAHRVIVQGLQNLDETIPILSEEGRSIPYMERKSWDKFWLIDPLDGTKEFIKKNGEFTVNIACIEGSYPSLGIIYAPALDVLYLGYNKEAYKLEKVSGVDFENDYDLLKMSVRLPDKENSVLRVIASRSHMSKETETFINDLKEKHDEIEVISLGSSLKFCLVAEGNADYYPRLTPSMEWDTAAGQAIVEAAGGKVINYEEGKRLYYNREDLRNGWMLAELP